MEVLSINDVGNLGHTSTSKMNKNVAQINEYMNT
jgi:hypothetical protein